MLVLSQSPRLRFSLWLTTSGIAHLQNPSRHVELDIDIGADARDWSAIQASEKLKPVETELRRIGETVNEIVQELEYLRLREQKLRDTNESTNERVKWFALGTMGMLVGLGAWQVVYLRAYFRYVAVWSTLRYAVWTWKPNTDTFALDQVQAPHLIALATILYYSPYVEELPYSKKETFAGKEREI